jgi:NitT/TauT family transport system ATP-binding protein/sulfonate transport system ATP-binding protein
VKEKLVSSSPIIEFRDVNKRYAVQDRELHVLGNLSLSIHDGEFLSIVGASGCGKSTLLRLLIGLDLDYGGEIRVAGERVSGPSLQRGIVFQDHRLFPWLTVEQNVALALENAPRSQAEKQRAIAEHISLVGLKGFERAYPHQLSGGMSQRAAIARGLINEPRILLLDEPFGALDALTRSSLQVELQRIWQTAGITMILVTHDVDEAVYLGDRVVVMEPSPGRIRKLVEVSAPRPRERSDAELQARADEVRNEILTADPS